MSTCTVGTKNSKGFYIETVLYYSIRFNWIYKVNNEFVLAL